MKRTSMTLALVGMACLSFNAAATKWKNGFVENIGGCEITHQYCDRQFLSFDGCDVGDTRAVFDTADSNCIDMLNNMHIL